MDVERTESAAEEAIAATKMWLERAVIGLNLCPFAKAVHLDNRVLFRVSEARSPEVLLEDLAVELRALEKADPDQCETTLLIHPHVLGDFIDYNNFLDEAEAVADRLGLSGEIQVASFHPLYQFADTEPDDIENYTNRSPYPALHLLREASVERAVAACSDPAMIYKDNIKTLRQLGHEGWRRLWLD